MSNNKLMNKVNKSLPLQYKNSKLNSSLKDYFSLNDFKLDSKRNLISLFDIQIRLGVKRITIKKLFIGHKTAKVKNSELFKSLEKGSYTNQIVEQFSKDEKYYNSLGPE